MKALFLILLTFSSIAIAQEQLAVRLNEKGLMKIMQLALKYNTGTAGSRTLVVPQNIYKFTVKQKDLAANPIIQVVNEISDLNLNKDLDFFFYTSALKVTGVVDQKSLVTTISNSKPDGFDVKLSINLTKVTLTGPSMSLCEDRIKTKCGKGLKATIKALKITTLNRPVVLTTNLRVSVKKGLAFVKVLTVNSNLESNTPPTLDINFESLEIPKIAIVINDQETELDTSRLREQILARKAFLGKKMLAFAGDFIAHDLAEMINIYLKNTTVATNIRVYHRDAPVNYNDMFDDSRFNTAAVDNTYVRPPIVFSPIKTPVKPIQKPVVKPVTTTPATTYDRYKPAIDNTYVKPPVMQYYQPKPAVDVMKILIEQFTQTVRHAQVDLSLKSISTPANKDIQLAGLLNLVLNHTVFKVKNTLGNSARTLPVLDLSAHRGHDINLAISEPVINGALDLVNSTGLFNDLLDEAADSPELSLNSFKIHFTNANSLKAVANVAVDMKKVRTSFWKDPQGWAETGFGTWLERNNNNSVIYFPLEFEIIPVVIKNATTGEATLSIKIKSAFNGDNLLNTYKYPSNVGDMYKIVRKAIIKKLHGKLDQYADKTFAIDLKKFLNQAGVEFMPKSISFNQAAYMLINLDIKDIKFNSKTPNKK
ncbi:MAG: hypothetical protein H0V66_07955 [Bdellovibrionales bacterium]|nr:hypothetical protein [Bdellovibrionales bacterium]